MIAREDPSPKPASSSDLAKEPLPKAPAKQIRRLWEAVRAGAAMIAKRIVRERSASNFRRLGRYILDGAAEEEQAVMARMAEYILGAEKSRAANVHFSNCVSTDAELALKEILATTISSGSWSSGSGLGAISGCRPRISTPATFTYMLRSTKFILRASAASNPITTTAASCRP